jgi:hypothetical protein
MDRSCSSRRGAHCAVGVWPDELWSLAIQDAVADSDANSRSKSIAYSAAKNDGAKKRGDGISSDSGATISDAFATNFSGAVAIFNASANNAGAGSAKANADSWTDENSPTTSVSGSNARAIGVLADASAGDS